MTDDAPAGAVPRRATPEAMAAARRLHETTDLTPAEIARRLGLYAFTVSRAAARDGWLRPESPREAVVRRIKGRVDAQIAAVEPLLAAAGPPLGLGEAERAARTLASLVRTLRELAKYDDERAHAAGEAEPDEPVADLDALRAALADRLDRLRQAVD